MTQYVTYSEYTTLGYNTLTAENATRYLTEASVMVDTLTFNRIVAQGFDNLTTFQKGIVQDVVCKQSDFLEANADAIASVIDSYAINGVSMKFGAGLNFTVENGIPTLSSILEELKQTGLTWRGAV